MTALIRTRHGQAKNRRTKNPKTPGQANAAARKRFIQDLKRQGESTDPFIGKQRFSIKKSS